MLITYPNINISESSELMHISFLQYAKKLKNSVFFGRARTLSIVDKGGHCLTTMRMQSGIEKGRLQGGLANDFNFYGTSFDLIQRFGLFLSVSVFK